MATAPIYKTKGNKDMEREGAGGKSDKGKSAAKPAGSDDEKPAADKKDGGDKGGAADDGAEKTLTPQERQLAERAAMVKRHESEMKDHHNNHREAMKQMHGRHQKDHADLNERQMADQADQGAGVTEGQQPIADTAEGGGAQSAAAA